VAFYGHGKALGSLLADFHTLDAVKGRYHVLTARNVAILDHLGYVGGQVLLQILLSLRLPGVDLDRLTVLVRVGESVLLVL